MVCDAAGHRAANLTDVRSPQAEGRAAAPDSMVDAGSHELICDPSGRRAAGLGEVRVQLGTCRAAATALSASRGAASLGEAEAPPAAGWAATPAFNFNDNNALYSGRLTPHAAPHALTGLVQGAMAIGRPPRGECEVRGKDPHMWALAAVAMGFSVRQIRWEDQSFGGSDEVIRHPRSVITI